MALTLLAHGPWPRQAVPGGRAHRALPTKLGAGEFTDGLVEVETTDSIRGAVQTHETVVQQGLQYVNRPGTVFKGLKRQDLTNRIKGEPPAEDAALRQRQLLPWLKQTP